MPSLELRSNQWIVDDRGRIIIGKGRMEILENIEKTGSINQTAKLMKMSYKAVWSKIKASERHLGTTLVHADRQKGSHLSREGRELVEKFRRLRKKCRQADDRIFSDIFD